MTHREVFNRGLGASWRPCLDDGDDVGNICTSLIPIPFSSTATVVLYMLSRLASILEGDGSSR